MKATWFTFWSRMRTSILGRWWLMPARMGLTRHGRSQRKKRPRRRKRSRNSLRQEHAWRLKQVPHRAFGPARNDTAFSPSEFRQKQKPRPRSGLEDEE